MKQNLGFVLILGRLAVLKISASMLLLWAFFYEKIDSLFKLAKDKHSIITSQFIYIDFAWNDAFSSKGKYM
jgi:hypothetical protein